MKVEQGIGGPGVFMPTDVSVSPAGSAAPSDGSGHAETLAAPGFSGALGLGVLALAFCAAPFVTWAVSGHWLPEVMVFGLAAALVGVVSRLR